MGLLYMLSAVIFPEVGRDDRVDLIDHFERHRRVFFMFLIGILAASIVKDLVLDHRLPTPLNLAFHFVLAAIALAGIVLRSQRVQLWLALFAVIGSLLYVSLLFAHL